MLEKMFVEQSKYTPQIDLDPNNRKLQLKGKSYPEDTFDFYAPMMDWIKNYFSQESLEKTIVELEIIYFNSSSSKLFFDFFDILAAASNRHNIEVNWLYHEENESAFEAGEDFKEDFGSLKFNLIEKA